MGHSNLTKYTAKEFIALTVADGLSGGGISSESLRTVASIKREIDVCVDVGNNLVRGEAIRLARKYPGNCNIYQICSIYEDLRENWYYVPDPRGIEYFQYANQTLNYGKAGDCDDFAILMSALIENIGVSTRVIFAYGPGGGHAYTEVYLGKVGAEDQRVERIIDRLMDQYDIANVNTHKDLKTDEVWLNLDWSADYPGGPFYDAEKNVVLRVRDGYDESPVNPPNELPLAIITYEPEEPSAGEEVTFNASQSRDPYGNITRYVWNFGDGVTAEGCSVGHCYSDGGVFNVNLMVTDNEGAGGTNSSEVRVNKPPVAKFGYSIKESEQGYFISFNASESKDEDGRIIDYGWDFGDGVKADGVSKVRIHHYYLERGSFIVNLTVTDDKGASDTESILIKINEPPVAKFSYNPDEPNARDEITFIASQSTG